MLIFMLLLFVQASALGGPAVLSLLSRHISNNKKEVLVIAVEDNLTSMKVSTSGLWGDKNEIIKKYGRYHNIVHARSYAECAGLLAAHKAGILFESLTSHVSSIPITRL